MKRIIIAAIVITLSTGISAQNHSETGVPSSSSLPSSTLLLTSRPVFPLSLPSSITLADASDFSSLDPPYLYNIDAEDRLLLFAGGKEGGGNPQKMPVGGGGFILVLLVAGYGVTRRRELRI
jgi:hypothetical protein